MVTNPLDTRPLTVAVVALGPSDRDYFMLASKKNPVDHYDEVWGVNSNLDVIVADKCFLMDDLRRVAQRYPGWKPKLTGARTPIVTCHAYPEFPAAHAYPIREVADCIGDDPFVNTICYIIAYAIYTKVQRLDLFGCDFWYPGSQVVEPGVSCVSYLLGIARERGVHFRIPNSSTLLDSNLGRMDETGRVVRPMYGYDFNPGESQARMARGQATDLDSKVAHLAPFVRPKPEPQEVAHAAHAAGA